MGKHVRVVNANSLQATIRTLKAEHQAERAKHPHAERYLRDYHPEIANKLAACRTKARVVPDELNGDRFRVRLYPCHVEPWCFACVNEAKHKRAQQALEKFQRCTPNGKQIRLGHIVQTAQLREDGTGWGLGASHRVKDFQQVIWKSTRDAYGPGIGIYASYQAFGERAFGKLHPHIDFTINGHTLDDDNHPQQTPFYDLTNGGHEKWVNRTREHVAARFLIDHSKIETNFKIQRFVTGIPAYYRAMLYQLREMVDVRKMSYDRTNRLVYWANYKLNVRERMTVDQFQEGLNDYQIAVGTWGDQQCKRLHVPYGHLADRNITATEKAMGGKTPAHRRGCSCGECNEWGEPIFPDEDGNYDFDPWAE